MKASREAVHRTECAAASSFFEEMGVEFFGVHASVGKPEADGVLGIAETFAAVVMGGPEAISDWGRRSPEWGTVSCGHGYSFVVTMGQTVGAAQVS